MVLGDPAPAGQALMRAYIGETIDADAVIYAVPGTKVAELVPELPA